MKKTDLILLGFVSFMAAGAVMAGADATFQSVAQTLRDWSEGSLGTTIAIGALVVGLGVGLVRQSLMPVVGAVGMAVAANWGPGILAGMASATI